MRKSMPNKYDEALSDFPRTELWRLQTDGCQHHLGKNNFTSAFYQGLQEGFLYIRNNLDKQISSKIIEDLYKSAFKFQEAYKNKEDTRFQKGIRDMSGSEMTLYLDTDDLKSDEIKFGATVSQNGLDEFIKSAVVAYEDKTDKASGPVKQRTFLPRWEIGGTEGNNWFQFNPSKFNGDVKAMHAYLENKLKLAAAGLNQDKELERQCKEKFKDADSALNEYLERKKTLPPTTEVKLIANAASRDVICKFIDKAIDKFNKQIQTKDIEEKKVAIIQLTRFLHQFHPFLDGNGRTFIFLMTNMLLLQHANTMFIANNPSHFVGFSTQELLKEVNEGIKAFEDCKITPAKNYLNNLLLNDFKNPNNVKSEIENKLSRDPIIAMGQLNEISLQVLENKITGPASGNSRPSMLTRFFNGSNENLDETVAARKQLMEILNDLYSKKEIEANRLVSRSEEFKQCKQDHKNSREEKAEYRMRKRIF